MHAFTNDTERFEALGDDQYVYHYTDEAGNACTYNMIIDDGGVGSMSMTSGALTLGIYNTTQLYEHSDQGEVNPIYTINRNAQVQIIGTHSAFNATGGSIYFTVDRNGTTCLNQDGVAVERLNAARLVFDSMTITDNVQLYLKPQTSWADLIQGTGAEYFTIENFVDSTGDQLKIGHEENGQYVYQKDRLFYSVGVEKVVDTGALADKNFKDQARLHIHVHDPHEVVPDGNLGDNMDDYLDDLDDDTEPDDIREPLDDIWNSDSKEEAQEKFDDLAGGIFGDWFNAQTQRITSLNNMLANRTIADDSGLDQFCQQCCCPNGQECNPYYPGPACNGCERCAARRQCGLGFQIGRMPRFCQPKRTAWASFIGDYGDSNYWKGFTKYHQESTGLAVGMEWRTVDCDKIGVYFNYSDSAITHGNSKGNSGSRVDSDDYNFGLYAKWDAIAFGGYGFANAAFTYNDINSERFYNTQNYNSQLYGRTNGLSTSVYLERGWLFAEDHGFVINPFLSIQYAYLQMDDFTESGSMANMRLHAYDMSYSSLRGQIGARISRDFIVGCQNWQILRLTLSGAWLHEFLDPQAEYYTELLGDTQHKQWFMKSNGAGRDYANLMFSLDYRFTKRLSANASYNAFFNQFQTINAASASLRFDF